MCNLVDFISLSVFIVGKDRDTLKDPLMEISYKFIVKTKINCILYQSQHTHTEKINPSFFITIKQHPKVISIPEWDTLIVLIQRGIFIIRKYNSKIGCLVPLALKPKAVRWFGLDCFKIVLPVMALMVGSLDLLPDWVCSFVWVFFSMDGFI